MPAWKILVFVLLFVAPVSVLVHWTVGSRVALVLGPGSAASRAAWALFAAMVVVLPLTMVATRSRLPPVLVDAISWIAFGWMGLMFVLLVTTLAGEVSVLALRAVGLASGRDLSKLVHGVRVAALGAGALAMAWGVRPAFAPPVVHEVHVAVKGLPGEFEGYRIAQLSDTHVSSLLGRRWAAALASRLEAASPDLLVHTGDLVDGTVDRLGPAVAELLRARGRDGSLFVTGNHETYSGVGAWTGFMEDRGWTVLRNRNLSISRGGASLHVAGIPDAHERPGDGGASPDVEAALAGIPDGATVVLLAHQPVQALQAAGKGVSLQLSGHTHGGQIWPFGHLVKLQQPVVEGLERVGDVPVFTSRGAGFWGPPVRLFARSEVPILVLHRAEG